MNGSPAWRTVLLLATWLGFMMVTIARWFQPALYPATLGPLLFAIGCASLVSLLYQTPHEP